jgi:hypothetical protein
MLHHTPKQFLLMLNWLALFNQWNQMIQTLTNKLTPQKRAFTGAAPTISVSPDQLSRCTPSAAVVQYWVLNLAIEQEIIMARLVSQHRVFGQSDGGQKGQEVRVLLLLNQETGKIVEHWSGLTCCGKKSNQVANRMKRDLARLSYPEACKKPSGSCSDSGAGTPESFAAACDEIVIWEADGMEDSCGLHDGMSVFRLPCNTWIGEGALAKRNAVQLLDTLWSFWSVSSKTKKWAPTVQKLWKQFSDDEDIPTGLFDAEPPSELTNALQCPLIARWWTIAVVALMFAKCCDFCLCVAKAVLSESKSNEEVCAIASNLLSLASSHWIRCGACFIAGFAGKWLNRHVKFHQGTDPVIGKPGHLSFRNAICCCLQIEDLKERFR